MKDEQKINIPLLLRKIAFLMLLIGGTTVSAQGLAGSCPMSEVGGVLHPDLNFETTETRSHRFNDYILEDSMQSSKIVSVNYSSDTPKRHWYLKTNTVGWAMLISNVAAEFELADHWSFNFPIYFSAMNYFTSKVKFRTFALQPEVRYWLTDNHSGWFGGAHFGLAWFNYAKGGDWRYQDHHRHSPMYGGGLNAGYRKSISKDGRWWLEFSLGGGIYHLNYDIFHNESNGKLVGSKKRTFYGVDHVGVSFAYRFDLKKGGNR